MSHDIRATALLLTDTVLPCFVGGHPSASLGYCGDGKAYVTTMPGSVGPGLRVVHLSLITLNPDDPAVKSRIAYLRDYFAEFAKEHE